MIFRSKAAKIMRISTTVVCEKPFAVQLIKDRKLKYKLFFNTKRGLSCKFGRINIEPTNFGAIKYVL